MSNNINNTAIEYLDPGFGADGTGRAPIIFPEGEYGIPTGITVAPDNKLLVACSVNGKFGLVRLTADGKHDSGFANNGFLSGEFALGYRSAGSSVKVLKNHQVLLTGVAAFTAEDEPQSASALALFEPDGTPVKTFGKGGVTMLEPIAWPGQTLSEEENNQRSAASADQNVSTVELPDGKIMVLGNHRYNLNDEVGMLMRVERNGSLDKTFGDGKGYVLITYLANGARVRSFIQLKDGTFVVGGSARIEDKTHIVIARFDGQGVPIKAFGSNGYAVFNVSPLDQLFQVMETPDGKILAILNIMPSGEGQTTALICLDANGNFADDFNEGQHLVISTPPGNNPTGGVCLDSGTIVVVGWTLGSDSKIFITKLKKDGKPLPDFGEDGMLFVNLTDSADIAHSMAIQHNQIVVGALSFPNSSDHGGTCVFRCSEHI
ncbi:hypothetical protein [Pseudomonas rustica]|uniref:hypothetical protein n=1 Tax=Pseudomonas rustica TaxID=2827099 RepID=UPI001BAFF289|nr:hypothetical protein [Pseudomonas rustica]MBS4086323.1 hypothetical protein [Pseudomonas rustica]